MTEKTKDRIGIFGGTFDPIHTGHLLFAEAAREQAGLSRVLFMPAHIQPFKQDGDALPDDDRLRVIKLATEYNPYFGVTTVETDKGGVSYTIDSLRALRDENPGTGICFLVGTDMFLNIEKWKDADALISEFDFVVGARPGYDGEAAEALADKLRKSHNTGIDFVQNPLMELSSTEIRRRIRSGESIRYRVPESARRYLVVREKVGEKRFEHTKRVIDMSLDMARRFGVSEYKAGLAALLHDYCKVPAGGIENDVMHGSMAAEAVAKEFGIKDKDVLNAIRFHTTGRAGMSKLERIIFLADTVEPGRTYNSISRLRETCLDDLEEGTYKVLVELKEYLLQKGLTVSEDTEAAIEELSGKVC